MYLLSKLVWVLIKPLNVFLLALITGAALSAWARAGLRRVGQWLVGLALAVFVALNLVPLGSWAVEKLEMRFPAPQTLPDRIDGIIVLGGVFNASLTQVHGTVSLNASADRLWAGLELARRYPMAKFVFTGGNGLPLTDVPGEAELAQRAYREVGLEGPRMIFETTSRNTRENAVLSQKLVQPQETENWLLVTSAAHMPRAVGSFRAIDWQVIPYPVDYTTGGTTDPIVDFSGIRQFGRLNQALREGAGLAYYYYRGWTEALFPAPENRPSP